MCSNLGDHMFGNVYVKYREEEEAERALAGLIGRHYAGQMLQVCRRHVVVALSLNAPAVGGVQPGDGLP